MSFSSAQWTIPELCVWIVTKDRDAVNGLTHQAKKSLKNTEKICPGAFSARDRVVEAAQRQAITVTCAGEPDRYNSQPPRRTLTPDFWSNAEILDSHAGWMADFAPRLVARRVDLPNKEYDGLLVNSAEALTEWPASTPEERQPRPENIATDPLVAPADTEISKWMIQHQLELKNAGRRHGRDVVLSAAREKFNVQYKLVKELWESRNE